MIYKEATVFLKRKKEVFDNAKKLHRPGIGKYTRKKNFA
jgi:hypothetical protein